MDGNGRRVRGPAASPDELLAAAQEHLALGRSLLPVGHDKRPHGQALVSTGHTTLKQGRVRGAWQSLQHTPASEQQVQVWLRPGWRGLGLVTGAVSGVIVIDVDKGEGMARFTEWGLSSRAHVRTRSGGLHWYLRHPGWPVRTVQSQTNKRLEWIRGIDVRGDGGYVVLPPTRFGRVGYEPLRDHRDLDDPSLLPFEVQVLLGLHAAPSAPGPRAAVSPAPASGPWVARDGRTLDQELLYRALELAHTGGRRNESGFWLACQLRDNGLSEADAEEVMRRYAGQVPDTNSKGDREAYTLQEARHSLGQAYRRQARAAWTPAREKKEVQTPLQRLQHAWPHLTPEQRAEAARCVAGARGLVRDQGLQVLASLGYSQIQTIAEEVGRNRQAGQAVPGLNGLLRLLDTLEVAVPQRQKEAQAASPPSASSRH